MTSTYSARRIKVEIEIGKSKNKVWKKKRVNWSPVRFTGGGLKTHQEVQQGKRFVSVTFGSGQKYESHQLRGVCEQSW